MSNNNLEKISSVCTNPKELITSDDFIKGLEIILRQVKGFDKDYILGLFDKIKNDKGLDKKEKDRLLKFLNNEKVEKKGKELLSKLKSVSVNLNINIENSDVFFNFSNLFNNIFAEDGYKKIHEHIRNVSNITELTLNKYKGFTKYLIDVKGVTKEIHLENTTLKVDSSDWEEIVIDGIRFKVNSEKSIIEFVEGKSAGYQLFTTRAAKKEAKKLGKRLPKSHNEFIRNSSELKAIEEKYGINPFINDLPGALYVYKYGESIFNSSFDLEKGIIYCTDRGDFNSVDGGGRMEYYVFINKDNDEKKYDYEEFHHIKLFASVRCVKD